MPLARCVLRRAWAAGHYTAKFRSRSAPEQLSETNLGEALANSQENARMGRGGWGSLWEDVRVRAHRSVAGAPLRGYLDYR